MQEVTIRLRFTRPSLGYARKSTQSGNSIYCMPRDGSGRVMFLPSWWRGRLRYAAKVRSRCQDLVQRIAWDTAVDGRLLTWRRIIVRAKDDPKQRERYALHEAFRPGDIIGVNAVLPDGLSIDAFIELLTLVGTYKGISPFQDADETYGTFEVVSVRPTIRRKAEEPVDAPVDQTTGQSH